MRRPPARQQPHIARLTTAMRDFRRVGLSNAFSARWLGSDKDAMETGQYDVLDRLCERESWRMGELAEALHVDPSAVSRSVVPLELRRLAARGPDPSDRRVVRIWATGPGRRQREVVRARGLQLWAEGLSDFTAEEVEQFASYVQRLTGVFAHLVFGSEPAEVAVVADPGRRSGSAPGPELVVRLQKMEERLRAVERSIGDPGPSS
jgi:DNA-binding MarR family transcriptional regulator